MKWYSKSKHRCLELDSVDYWEYSAARDDVIKLHATLHVVVHGYEVKFFDDEALELFELLSKKQSVLHS